MFFHPTDFIYKIPLGPGCFYNKIIPYCHYNSTAKLQSWQLNTNLLLISFWFYNKTSPGAGARHGRGFDITAFCGSLRRLSFFRRYRRVESGNHRDHCGSPQSFLLFHLQKTDPFSRTNTRFLGMIITAANHLRVLDVLDRLDYNGFLFPKSRFLSNFPLDECETQRILFRFPWTGRKP